MEFAPQRESPGVRTAVPGQPVESAAALIGGVLSEAESAQLLCPHTWQHASEASLLLPSLVQMPPPFQ